MARVSRQRPVAGQRSRARLRGAAPGEAGTPAPLEAARTSATALAEPPAAPPQQEEPTYDAAPLERAAPRAPWPPWARRALAALLALGVAATAAVALLFYRVSAGDRVEAAREQALAAATQDAVVLLSYDYRHLDADFARARQLLTGRFRSDYVATTRVIRPTATRYKAVVRAEVAASSVVRARSEQVVVLLFVNQTTTSTRLEGPKVDLNRVRLRMARVDGKWLVSDVQGL
ncbi:MAG: Mce-associated rane protein [Actinomycetota bacterium]|jgi:Mce-associated membrane protein|nr:Mce-associated rane protein [Actinomycetota bacterium]